MRGSAGERPCSKHAASSASHSTPEARGGRRGEGKAAGVAGWRQNRNAAARDGKANGAGGSRGGVSEAKALAEAGRGGVRAQRGGAAVTSRGAPRTQAGARKDAPARRTRSRRDGGSHAHAGPKGSHALRARGSCPAAVRGLRTACARGGGGAGACLKRSEGRGAPHPHGGAEPHSARRRARLDWRRGQPRASEG